MAMTVYSPTTCTVDLEVLILDAGAHGSPDEGMCLMEAASVIAGEPWSDRPACVSPVITAFVRTFNDTLTSIDRQQLKQHLQAVIGTRTTRHDDWRRAWLVCDWLVRAHAPAWLHLVHAHGHAKALSALPLVTAETAPLARPIIDAAGIEVDASLQAMRLGSVDSAVANAAGWDTAYEAAYDALATASDGAGFVCNDDWDAALGLVLMLMRLASDRDLDGTVADLQESAHGLIRRMCEVGR